MLDAFFECLDVPEHHCCRADTTEFMPNSHHVQPIVGENFTASDFSAHTIDQDFCTATAHADMLENRHFGKERRKVGKKEEAAPQVEPVTVNLLKLT